MNGPGPGLPELRRALREGLVRPVMIDGKLGAELTDKGRARLTAERARLTAAGDTAGLARLDFAASTNPASNDTKL